MNIRSTILLLLLVLFVVALSALVVVAQSTGNDTFLPVIINHATPVPSSTMTITPSSTSTPTSTATNTPTQTNTSTTTGTPTHTSVPHFPLAYGPYRTGQAPGGATPSPVQIGEDQDILKAESNLIRTYGSCNELFPIPALAGERMIQLYQGVWLSSDNSANQQELACYAQLLQENDNIHAGIIGNEALLRGDLTETQLADYLMQAQQLGNVPITTGETWAKWCNLQTAKPRCPGLPLLRPKADFIFIHVHPYWEAVPIEHAAAHVIAVQIFVRTTYTEKEVVVGESGWPTCGSPMGGAVPGVDNQRHFIQELWKWANLYNIRMVYFEAFDEAWKNEPNGVGPCWGMYNADRTPKHTTLDWAMPMPTATPTTPTVQIDYPSSNITTTTKSNCGIPAFGRVYQAQPGWQVRIEVFTNQWYLQDQWYANGLAPIIDGQWSVPDLILAGQGQFNNHKIRATLLDAAGNAVSSMEGDTIVRANAACIP